MAQARPADPGPVLISKSEIATRVKSLADEISRDYRGQRIKVGVVLARSSGQVFPEFWG